MGIEILERITPRESVASAARNCYSKNFVYPQETITWIGKFNNTDKLVKDLLSANHNTTFEHFYLTFKITGYSRHFIWRYLHGINDFYSTDQQSQRYVKLNEENFYYPDFLTKEDKEKWEHFYKFTFSMYEELVEDIDKILEKYYPDVKGFKRKKIGQELSRYIIPLGQTPHLTWTVNFITILRYIALFEIMHENNNNNKFEIIEECKRFSSELKNLILKYPVSKNVDIKQFLDVNLKELKKNLGELRKNFQNFLLSDETDDELKEIQKKIDILEAKINLNENYLLIYQRLIENLIDIEKKKIKLENFWNYKIKKEYFELEKPKVVNICNSAVSIFASFQDYSFYPLNKGYKSLINFTTVAFISHSADSQNQRHRTTIKLRPLLKDYYFNLKNKYYIPRLFLKYHELKEKYNNIMKNIYEFFEEQSGKYGFNNVLYLLPNAQKVFVVDSDNMEYYTHKAMKRLCYNSQEEIWHYTYEQVIQLEKHGLDINKLNLLPPCHVRKKFKIKPFCEEGDRYCGNAVWKKDFYQLKRDF